MGKGPGHIARTILAMIDADPDGAWLISDICAQVYPGETFVSDQFVTVEKKHRVAVARALRTMKLPGTWTIRWVKTEVCLCDPCNLTSLVRRDWLGDVRHGHRRWGHRLESIQSFRERRKHWYEPSDIKSSTFAEHERATKYRDTSPVERIDMDIEEQKQRISFAQALGCCSREYRDEIMLKVAKLQEQKAALQMEPAL